MNLEQIMQQKNFAVLGDTLNPEKYAFRIKQSLLKAGYRVYPVGKELPSLNDIDGPVDVIDLCIHPVKGLELLKEYRRPLPMILIQPGAASPELLAWLEASSASYLEGCALKGLAAHPPK